MKFLVDGMLGGLAKWLRMLGHNVEYSASADDDTLLLQARETGMILLTSDHELSRRAVKQGVDCLLLQGKNETERLAEVAKTFGIPLVMDMAKTKCPECGNDLRPVLDKEEVSARVPRASLQIYNDFWACTNPACEKVYWKGSHWGQIHNTLESARLLSDK